MRLIDADALKEKKVYSEERHEKVVPVAEIDWMPTIEAEPVKHGRWMWMETALGRKYCGCSVCKSPIPSDSVLDFIDETDNVYCYNCGAKMDEVEE